jgi:hypothetical protein
MLVGLFVLRETTSGALKGAGKELENWARAMRPLAQPPLAIGVAPPSATAASSPISSG